VVEIDPETYRVSMLCYVAAEDCGTVINPMIVDGQVHGGAQGVGAALLEEGSVRLRGDRFTDSLADDLALPAPEILQLEVTPIDASTTLGGFRGMGEGQHDRRAGGDRQCRRRCAGAARYRGERAADGRRSGSIVSSPPRAEGWRRGRMDYALQGKVARVTSGGRDVDRALPSPLPRKARASPSTTPIPAPASSSPRSRRVAGAVPPIAPTSQTGPPSPR
jgi:hypothetical protein